LNARYLQEALATVNDKQIVIETQTSGAPGVFKPASGEGYVHLIMPMSLFERDTTN
jgi:DNA polymerase III sliding clamp (beta) subunit (PCNA family)